MHPTRRKLAGRPAGDLYDRLLEAQVDLARGNDGIDKPLSCSAALLAKVAANRPTGRTSNGAAFGRTARRAIWRRISGRIARSGLGQQRANEEDVSCWW